ANLYHIPRSAVRQRAEEVLDLVGLLPAADRLFPTYSGGMQKRLDLACGLLHRPQLLILDEPTLGLDVQSRHNVWQHVRDLQAQGTTILLATNYLDEADRLCGRLTIIDKGKAVVTGTPSELKRAVGADVVVVEAPRAAEFADEIAGEPWLQRTALTEPGQLNAYVHDAATALPALMRIAADRGIHLEKVTY